MIFYLLNNYYSLRDASECEWCAYEWVWLICTRSEQHAIYLPTTRSPELADEQMPPQDFSGGNRISLHEIKSKQNHAFDTFQAWLHPSVWIWEHVRYLLDQRALIEVFFFLIQTQGNKETNQYVTKYLEIVLYIIHDKMVTKKNKLYILLLRIKLHSFYSRNPRLPQRQIVSGVVPHAL